MLQVLAVSCGLQDMDNLGWWKPYPSGSASSAGGKPWLPWALEVASHPKTWEVTVREGDTPAELAIGPEDETQEGEAVR